MPLRGDDGSSEIELEDAVGFRAGRCAIRRDEHI
jgi:hypothetical protein